MSLNSADTTCMTSDKYWASLNLSLKVKVLVAQSCPTLCDPMDCSPPGSSVHEIFQARILEWVTISFCRGSSQPRDRTQVSCTTGRFFTDWATREAPAMPETQEMWVRSLGQKDALEKEMATHSSILAWKIPWTEEPGGLQSMGSQRVKHNLGTKHASTRELSTENRWCRVKNLRGPWCCAWVNQTKLKE